MGLNVDRIKLREPALNEYLNNFNYVKYYQINKGHYPASCEWPHLLNDECFYLNHGCTGCLRNNKR